MHALIVVAHHDPQSLTHSVALEVGAGLAATGVTRAIGSKAIIGILTKTRYRSRMKKENLSCRDMLMTRGWSK